MPQTSFESLPRNSKVWVFAADPELGEPLVRQLLAEVDDYLDSWTAHGAPLTCARDWRECRFLTVGVDQTAAHASGCSIDGLYRRLAAFEQGAGISLLSKERVFYRDESGTVRATTRETFSEISRSGDVSGDTPVFDTSVTTLEDWYTRFEIPASASWHSKLLSV